MKDAVNQLLGLCRGDPVISRGLLQRADSRTWWLCFITITVGCAMYGAAVGWWRAPQQSLNVAIKMPLLVFATCAANALLNGLLAQVLGAGLSFRQSSLAILMSFTIAAIILAALSPVALFIIANAPPLSAAGRAAGHSLVLLSTVVLVAYAGIVANYRLLRLLIALCVSKPAAHRVFWSWLAGNLFLGAQLSWILRPFIGSPGLPVQFLRDDPLRGNFYESVGRALFHLFS